MKTMSQRSIINFQNSCFLKEIEILFSFYLEAVGYVLGRVSLVWSGSDRYIEESNTVCSSFDYKYQWSNSTSDGV